jgi:hypothetical protein
VETVNAVALSLVVVGSFLLPVRLYSLFLLPNVFEYFHQRLCRYLFHTLFTFDP